MNGSPSLTEKLKTSSALPAWLLSGVLMSIVLLFGLLNGIPWPTREAVAVLQEQNRLLQTAIIRTGERLATLEEQSRSRDALLSEMRATIGEMNRKIDGLILSGRRASFDQTLRRDLQQLSKKLDGLLTETQQAQQAGWRWPWATARR